MAGPGALTPLHECATSDALRCAELLAPLARDAATVASRQLEEALNGAMEVDQQVGGEDGGRMEKSTFFCQKKLESWNAKTPGLGNSNQLYMVNWDVC